MVGAEELEEADEVVGTPAWEEGNELLVEISTTSRTVWIAKAYSLVLHKTLPVLGLTNTSPVIGLVIGSDQGGHGFSGGCGGFGAQSQ